MNKAKRIIAFSILSIIFIIISICVWFDTPKAYEPEEATILLYGETHGIKEFYDAEFATWKACYEEEGMRDLFVELPYYTAEFLNVWMQKEDDALLDQWYAELEGTASYTTDYMDFFKQIKEECPETVFHGTDVGHQAETTGMRYLTYLEKQGLEDSAQYKLAIENMEQGNEWYERQNPVDWNWREEQMIANFVREYDSLNQRKIMGIYGTMHIDVDNPQSMAGALKVRYGDVVSSTYVYSQVLEQRSYQLGYSYIGFGFLIFLFVPNMIWTKHQPKNYDKYVKNENKVLLAFERVGQALTTVTALIFTDFNAQLYAFHYGAIVPARMAYLHFAFILMLVYEVYWIRYFRSDKTMMDFYKDFLGIPLPGATLPVLAFALLGLYGGNLIMIASVTILGIGHIGIHRNHYKEAMDAEID